MNKKREQKDFKKGQGNQEDNYRSESNLANISKLFGRSLLQQLSSYFDNIRWMHQFGFRKDFNQQLCLAAVIESRKANTVLGKSFWASPKDFSPNEGIWLFSAPTFDHKTEILWAQQEFPWVNFVATQMITHHTLMAKTIKDVILNLKQKLNFCANGFPIITCKQIPTNVIYF